MCFQRGQTESEITVRINMNQPSDANPTRNYISNIILGVTKMKSLIFEATSLWVCFEEWLLMKISTRIKKHSILPIFTNYNFLHNHLFPERIQKDKGLLMKSNQDKNGLEARAGTFPCSLWWCFQLPQKELARRVVTKVFTLFFLSLSTSIHHFAIHQLYPTTRGSHLDGFPPWQLHSTTSGTCRDSHISNCSQSRGIQFPWIIGTLLWHSDTEMWQIHQVAQQCADGPGPGKSPWRKSLCLNGMR